jgi:hypothetical protein
MAQTASPPLAEAILAVMSQLIFTHEKEINRDSLVPMYQFALHRIVVFPSAIEFLQRIAKIDPSIAAHHELIPSVQKTADDVLKEILMLGNRTSETVPITDCKDLSELYGLINQKNPPKISPFATHLEMYLGLSKEWRNVQRNSSVAYGHSLYRANSNTSLRSSIVSNRSFILAKAMITQGIQSVQWRPLEAGPIKSQLLDIPPIDNGTWKFVVTPGEFASLEDE